MTIRLQKYLAEAGVASRRAAEQIIEQGRVRVNGRVVTQLGTQIDPRQDKVTVDSRPVRVQRKLYLALNKPKGVVCTRSDEKGRRTVLDLLPEAWRKVVYPVGRLDRDTEGLLLLTNDGEFCLKVTHPRYGVVKRYFVTVRGQLTPEVLPRLTRGVVCEGERLRAKRARLLRAGPAHTVLALELTEGRNREVRRLFWAIGFRVEHLCRERIGPVRLGELAKGKWRVLVPAEIDGLSSDF